MNVRILFFLALIVYISIIQVSTINQHSEEDEDEDDQLKRFIFNPKLAPALSSSDICAFNPCENDGICIPKEEMNYECKCIDKYYGKHCEKSFQTRSISKHRSYKILNNLKRILDNKRDSQEDISSGRAYYDHRNGIYF